MKRVKRRYIAGALILVILVAVRLALPAFAKNHINRQLDALEGYHASIEDVSVQLYRGGFQIAGLRIVEEASVDTTIPMVYLPLLDFSIQWRALLEGRFVGEVYMNSPVLNLTRLREEEQETGSAYRIAFMEEVQELNPIELNRFEAVDAQISYRDPTSDPPVHIAMTEVQILARNLGNVYDPNDPLPAVASFNGKAWDEGDFQIDGRLNLLRPIPDFDINVKIEKIPVVQFSDWTEARSNLPLKGGLLFFYAEMIAEEGQLNGYVKPMVENLTIEKDENGSIFEKVYQTAANAVAQLFEDNEKDQIATRVEISGTLDDPETKPWQIVLNLLRNAFVEAYGREIDHILEFGNAKDK